MKIKNRILRSFTRSLIFVLVSLCASQVMAQSPARIVFTGSGKLDKKSINGSQLFSMNPDGSGLVQLTKVSAYNRNAAWSPGQTHIAFQRSASSIADGTIYVMESTGEANGGAILTVGSGNEPDWSPDGTQICFSFRADTSERYDIYIVAVDVVTGAVGTPTPLVVTPSLDEFRPAWSPDGTKIAFTRDLDPCGCVGTAIIVRELPTGTETQLPYAAQGLNSNPAWSPDGSRITFDGPENSGSYSSDIYVVNADGTGLARLVELPNTSELFSTWSPDGSAWAFRSDLRVSRQQAGPGIFRLDAATGGLTRITPLTLSCNNPDWTP